VSAASMPGETERRSELAPERHPSRGGCEARFRVPEPVPEPAPFQVRTCLPSQRGGDLSCRPCRLVQHCTNLSAALVYKSYKSPSRSYKSPSRRPCRRLWRRRSSAVEGREDVGSERASGLAAAKISAASSRTKPRRPRRSSRGCTKSRRSCIHAWIVTQGATVTALVIRAVLGALC
jgi:hypothetical protein